MTRKALLGAGIVASLLYVAMNVLIPLQWEGYSLASRVVSELSAIDAPTRSLWVPLALIYSLLVIAFGCGVWISARERFPLRVVGGALVAASVIGLFWPPMHQREVLAAGGGSLTDTLHIVWSFAWVVLMMIAIGFGAAGLGRRFREYSIVTAVILVLFGALTGAQGPQISANLPTPLIGVWERINIGVVMLWMVVLAVALWRPVDAPLTFRKTTLSPTMEGAR